MNDSLVTQFGAPDAPYCDSTTARVTIIPAPLEYSVCYMKGTEHGPQAILNASSQMELLFLAVSIPFLLLLSLLCMHISPI